MNVDGYEFEGKEDRCVPEKPDDNAVSSDQSEVQPLLIGHNEFSLSEVVLKGLLFDIYGDGGIFGRADSDCAPSGCG